MQARAPRATLLLLAASFVVLVLLLALGTWQVQRLAWKQALVSRIETRVASPPVALRVAEAEFAQSGDVDYLPVSATGSFVHDAERHFFATHQGQSGWYVYTPLRLAGGRHLWVNRGFVPYDRKDPATRLEGQVEGELTLEGLARNPLDGKPSVLLPDNDPAGNVFYWKDIGAMSASSGLAGGAVLPFFVDANAAENPGGLPAGGVTMVSLPNNHLQYAVTWYGLAGALVVILGFYVFRRNRGDDASSRP